MEIVKTEDTKEVTDTLSTIKVSSAISYMEQVNFRCDKSEKEAGFEFIKCEKSPEVGKNTGYDTEMRIKTEVEDEVDTQEDGVNYKHLRFIETGDYEVDSQRIVGKEGTSGSVKCEINPKEEETTGYDTEIKIKDEVDVGHGVNYEPLIFIKIESNVNNVENIKHEQIFCKKDTDGIEMCTEKQNAVQQSEPNCCDCEYETEGLGKCKLNRKDDLVRHCKHKDNIKQHKRLLPDNTNLQTPIKVTRKRNAKQLKCQYCDYITNHSNSIKIHLATKHNENGELYQCSSCEYKTGYKRYLLEHYKWKHDNAAEIFHCEVCDFKTKAKYNLSQHHRLKHDDTAEVFRCEQCEYKTKLRHRLLQHHRSKHDDSAAIFHCKKCDFKTKIEYNLLRHHRSRHDDSAEVLLCNLCDFRTKTKSQLIEHHGIKHAAESFHCGRCDFKTKYKNYLLRHHKLKHDVAEFFHCKLCNFKTKNKSYLSRHHKLKHGDASGIFHCEFCDFETKYRCNFLEHRTLKHYDATESFHCALCDFETKYKYSLLKHRRSMHQINLPL